MKDEEVFLVTEVWLIPGTWDKFKSYRVKVLNILEQFGVEYIHYNHAFEWVFDSGDGDLPTGNEICRFPSEAKARAAIAAIENSGLREEEKNIFKKVRCYLSRYAPASNLKQ